MNVREGDAQMRDHLAAAAAAEQQGDRLALAQRLRCLGDLQRAAGRRDRAEAFYEEALLAYSSIDQAAPAEIDDLVGALTALWVPNSGAMTR
jgi:hypothetical protein